MPAATGPAVVRFTALTGVLTATLLVGIPAARATAAKPECRGDRATIVGTGKSDRLRATKGPDVVVALGGPDRVVGADRQDVVCAGAGRDRLISQLRVPRRREAAGRARKGEQSGVGYMVLGGGADEVTIDCADGAPPSPLAFNQIDAGGGDDTIESDCPFGDSIEGGPGEDTVTIGRGQDRAYGGPGDDRLVDRYSVAEDCEQDIPPWGFELDWLPDRRCITFRDIGESWYDFEDTWWGGDGDDRIVGGEANDLVSGEAGDDDLGGGPGDDSVSGGDGTDICDGGPGTVDTNSGEGTRAIGDCEQMRNFEPVPDPPPWVYEMFPWLADPPGSGRRLVRALRTVGR